MVTPIRTQTISVNNLIDNTLTHTEQFQEIFFQVKELFVAAGGTILISNGGGVAGAGDNIASAADVTTGLAGTGAWYVVEFSDLGGGEFRMLVNVNDNAAPIQSVQTRGGPGTWSGGNTTTLPTLTGFAWVSASVNMHPFTDVRNLRWSTWRTPNVTGGQSIRFVLKEDGAISTHFAIFLEGNTSAENSGAGLTRMGLYFASTATTSAAASVTGESALQTAANWRAMDPSGSASVTTQAQSALWGISTLWTTGLDVDTQCPWESILIGQNVAGGRTLGLLIDAYAVPRNIALGAWIDVTENAQAQRRKSFNATAMFWPTGIDIL